MRYLLAIALIAACGPKPTPVEVPLLPTDGISPLFQAVLEATEEAVYNSLLKATPVTSRWGTAEALPVDRVREIIARIPK